MNVPKCLTNISPRWAKILDTYSISDVLAYTFLPTNHGLENISRHDEDLLYQAEVDGIPQLRIGNFACCIVGEAWNLNEDNELNDNRYGDCRECYNHSMRFCTMLEEIDGGYESCDEETDISITDYEAEIELFCEHIGSEHPELIKNDEVDCE